MPQNGPNLQLETEELVKEDGEGRIEATKG